MWLTICVGVLLCVYDNFDKELPTSIIRSEIEGRRRRGRPRTIWTGNITESAGCGYVAAARKARHRNYWQQLTAPDPAISDDDPQKVITSSVREIRACSTITIGTESVKRNGNLWRHASVITSNAIVSLGRDNTINNTIDQNSVLLLGIHTKYCFVCQNR